MLRFPGHLFDCFKENLSLFNCTQTPNHTKTKTGTPAWQKCDTTRFGGPFLSVSSLRLLQLSLFCFLGAAPFSCLTAPSPPVLQPVFLLSPLTFLSFCVHLCSLPCSLPSALRQTLCRTQPETRSPLLFPGSLSLCFYASLSFRGPQAEPSPLPLSGCHHFLSTLIVPRTHSLTPKQNAALHLHRYQPYFKTLYTPDNPPPPSKATMQLPVFLIASGEEPHLPMHHISWRKDNIFFRQFYSREDTPTVRLAGSHTHTAAAADCHVKVMDLIRTSVSRYQKWSVALNNKSKLTVHTTPYFYRICFYI